MWSLTITAALAVAALAPRGGVRQLRERDGAERRQEESQPAGERRESARLVVMLRGTLGDAPTFGAGVIVGRDGPVLYVATANHVVRRGGRTATALTARLRDAAGAALPARVLPTADPALDLALLAVDVPRAFPTAPLCGLPRRVVFTDYAPPGSRRAAEDLRGERVYAVGNPNGVAWGTPLTADLVAGVDSADVTFQSPFIGVGHSGGALLLDDGALLGMIKQDAPPFGVATRMDVVLERVRRWGYPVPLGPQNVREYKPYLVRLAEARDTTRLRRVVLDEGCIAAGDRASELREAMAASARRADTVVTAFLLGLGASPDSSDANSTDTPMTIAAARGDTAFLRFMLRRGAKLDAKSWGGNHKYSWTPLAAAVKAGQIAAAGLLRRAGANPAVAAWDRNSPTPMLHAAAQDGDVATLSALLELGADPNAKDDQGRTPLYYAQQSGRAAGVTILRAAGAR